MSEPIKVGDLVMVVKWPHEHRQKYLGHIFPVQSIAAYVSCSQCGQLWVEPTAETPTHRGVPISWLKKIPPLSELDDVKRDEEITA